MSDVSRKQKLASAKKKLKKFQQTKSPESPPGRHLNDVIIQGIQNNHIFKTPPIVLPSQNIPVSDDNKNTPKKMDFAKPPLVENNRSSPVENIVANGDTTIYSTPIAGKGNEIDLQESLLSYKRSNQQLTKQVNEQRRQLLLFQEKLQIEKAGASQFMEQKALKEQLEVHIQTIGILVSEKSELQYTIMTLQKKLSLKETDIAQLNQRLDTSRKNIEELEKRIAQLQTSEGQYKRINKEIIQERDRFSSRLYEISHEKEELQLQNAEVRAKLQVKVEECSTLCAQVNELHARLQKGEIMFQQLSTNKFDADTVSRWQTEKEELLHMLEEQKGIIQKLIEDKTELMGKNADQQLHFDHEVAKLKNKATSLEDEKVNLLDTIHRLTGSLQNLQNDIVGFQRKAIESDSSIIVTPEEFQALKVSKEDLEKELDVQISESRRLGLLVFEQNTSIEDLQSQLCVLTSQKTEKATLLEQIQSDKETISRALQQNKALKEQLSELEEGFVKMSNNSADLTGQLESEQHSNKDVASKLSEMQIDIEETKIKLNSKTTSCLELEGQVKRFKDELYSVKNKLHAKEMDLELISTELETAKHQLLLRPAECNDVELRQQLMNAQETISQLSYQNSHLQVAMQQIQPNQSSDEGSLYPTREMDSSEEQNDSESSWEAEEEMENNKAINLTSHQVEDIQAELAHLQNERLKVIGLLQHERERAFSETEKLDEHVELRVKQQLARARREMQEHFYEQTETLHSKVKSLQEALEIMRKNEDIADFDMTSDGITMPLLKTAFMQLQKSYKNAMEGKAQLADRLDQLEHMNVKLESETETIGEYVALYQTQRQALKEKFDEKDRLISQLSNEHARMQNKVAQLHQLVIQMIGQNGEHKKLEELLAREQSIELDDETSSHDQQTTQQILQIFEQLETTGEGCSHGWLSPAARRHAFKPCRQCEGPLINI